jgi:hypothetical protein
MKIKLPVRAGRIRLKQGESPYVVLKELNRAGSDLLTKLFEKKKQWEEYNKKEFYLQIVFELQHQKRTFKQNSSVWKLIDCIWLSMEKDPPTEEEKYSLYLDLLEVYADKVKNRITGELRPIHISESNSIEGARFIDGLLYHLSTVVGNFDYNTQNTVIDVLQEWEEWRGSLEIDPMDYSDLECTKMLTEAEWREKHKVSEASGQGGIIDRCHIVSRGADAADIEKSWNWLALTHEEHMMQHKRGWDEFIRIYPHLKGRIERARRLAHKLDLEFKNSQMAIAYNSQNLAMEALNE